MKKISAPFTEKQMDSLNAWQNRGDVHPFTCSQHSNNPLVATRDGWHCAVDGCDYTQNWAHNFMVT